MQFDCINAPVLRSKLVPVRFHWLCLGLAMSYGVGNSSMVGEIQTLLVSVFPHRRPVNFDNMDATEKSIPFDEVSGKSNWQSCRDHNY